MKPTQTRHPKKRADKELAAAKVRMRVEAAIRSVPHGKVSTYGAVARAAGLAQGARQAAQVLHRGFDLPWQRILGARGQIKLTGDHAIEQRFRLEAEGVRFRGRRVDMKLYEYEFPGSRKKNRASKKRFNSARSRH